MGRVRGASVGGLFHLVSLPFAKEAAKRLRPDLPKRLSGCASRPNKPPQARLSTSSYSAKPGKPTSAS